MKKPSLAQVFLAITSLWLSLTAQAELEQTLLNTENSDIRGSRYEDAKNHGLFPTSCNKKALQRVIFEDKELQDFFDRCDRFIKNNNHFFALIKYSRTKFPLARDKVYKQLDFTLTDGTKLRGILVLSKESSIPRPLILIKGGIYADAIFRGSSSNLLLHYGDESSFHALYLESSTAKEYVRRNKEIAFGGLIESHQLIEVLRELESSDLAEFISEVHIVGISLGGNGALLLENSLTHVPSLGAKFYPRSVTAHCPVVNLKRSFRSMFSSTLAGRGGSIYLTNLLQDVRDDVPLIDSLFGERSVRSCSREELEDIIQVANIDFYRRYYRRYYGTRDFEPERDIFKANDYRNFCEQVDIPTYIIHAKDDHIVRYSDNIGLLLQTHGDTLSKNIQTLILNQGDHCAYAHVYNWGHMTTLFKSIIYHHSDEHQELRHYDIAAEVRSERTIFGNPSIRFKKGDAIADYYFKKYQKRKGLKLKFKIFRSNRDQGDCAHYSYYRAPQQCYDFESIHLSPKSLGLAPPTNKDQENIILRRLNSQGLLIDSHGYDVRGQSVLPQKLRLTL